MTQCWPNRLLVDNNGATAVEFAIIAPVVLMIMFGIIQLSVAALTVASLHYAAEKGARCAALKTDWETDCDFTTYYFAPGSPPKFVLDKTEQPCGVMLTATVTYNLSVLVYQRAIKLSGKSCFPNLLS